MKKIKTCCTFGFVAILFSASVWAVPITDADRVGVNGATWAQANLFAGLTWSELNDQCPAGICSAGSILNSYDMSGWNWAANTDVAELLNSYMADTGIAGSDLLDPTGLNDNFIEYTDGRSLWIQAISADFRRTGYDHTGGYYLSGGVSSFPAQLYGVRGLYAAQLGTYNRAFAVTPADAARRLEGAWFYCTDNCPSAVDVAALPTAPLFVAALAVLGCVRRRRSREVVIEHPR